MEKKLFSFIPIIPLFGYIGITSCGLESAQTNEPPIANAGQHQIVNEGDNTNLDGAGSSDPDGAIIAYAWTQNAGPPVTLDGTDTATPSFTALAVTADTVLTFQLEVTDDGGATAADQIRITVQNVNQFPIANAQATQTVNEGAAVSLDGNGSNDPDGTITAYNWIRIAGPVVTLTGSNTASPSFTAPAVTADTVLTFQLEVTDDGGATAADQIRITVQNVNQFPIANAQATQTVNEGATVSLDGNGSNDPDGTITAYNWTRIAGPVVTLIGSNTASPSFTAPVVTADTGFTFQLEVTDNDGATDADQVNITVQNVLPSIQSFAFDARQIYGNTTTSIQYKQSAVQEISRYFDAMHFGVYSWSANAMAELQEWIGVHEANNLGFIFSNGQFPGTYFSADISNKAYQAVNLNLDGTFNVLAGDGDYDVMSPAAAQYRADMLKDQLLLLSTAKDVYFMFNEDKLMVAEDSQTYYNSPSYSDGDLQSFRDYLGDQTAKFPVGFSNIPLGSQYKIAYAAQNNALWAQWWDWRFRAFADYLDKIAQAVSEALAGNPNYGGTIYVGENTKVFEVSGVQMPALSLEYIAESPYITVLLSDLYGTYFIKDLTEKGNEVYKRIAESHGKFFSTMVDLWLFNQKSMVGLRAVSEQIERNHKYQPEMTSAYIASVFHQGLGWSEFATNPIMAELWDVRENLVPPGTSFRHAGFDWGSYLGAADLNANPPWVTTVNQSGGYADLSRSSYRVNSTASRDIGGLEIRLDRSVVRNDQTLGLTYQDNANAYMYIQLMDANGTLVVNNLTGNILTGTGNKLTTNFNIPLANNPSATTININRSFGNFEVYYTWLSRYPRWYSYFATEDDLWIEDLQNSGGNWDSATSSYKVTTDAATDAGSLKMRVDRSVIVDDMTLTLDYWDSNPASSYMYIRLRDANGSTVINNLIGNMFTGTASRVTRDFTIPLRQNSNAVWIDITRYVGWMEVFSATLTR